MKIYLVKLESNVDGDVMFNAVPCATIEKAREILAGEKETILNESNHWSNLTEDDWKYVDKTDEEDHFYVNDMTDDFWEDYYIVEKDLEE